MAPTSSDSDDLLLGGFLDDEDLHFLEPQEVRRLIWEQVPLVDARSAQEYLRYHLKSALHIPHNTGQQQVDTLLNDRTKPVIIYSNGQNRAEQLARKLMSIHYRHVYILGGGISALQAHQDA